MKGRRSILIVDEDIAHRTMLRIILDWQYDIFETQDGGKALAAVNGRQYDLILLDARTMHKSGPEALQASLADAAVRVIVMTAGVADAAPATGRPESTLDCIAKPLDFDKLRLLIDQAMASADTRLQSTV